MAAAQHLIDDLMARAVAEFDTNPLCGQLLRRLSNEVPDQFCMAALEYLASNENSNFHRLLSILMLRQPSIYDQLMNPLYGSKQRAIHLFRRLLAVDPSFDLKLARRLPDKHGGQAFCDSQSAARGIEILDEASSGRRLLPILGHLVHSEDVRISAKATLLVGRRLQNPEWAARQLKRDDARIRANAIESIWGLKSPRAKTLLEQCLTDSSGRVKGNSLVGLHLIGESGVAPQVGLLAANSDYGLRSTAAWTMGRIGDPCFMPNLNALIRDDHPQVRGAALRSLIEIRRIESKTAHALAARAEEAARAAPEVVAEKVAKAADAFGAIDIHLDGSSYAMGSRG
jgi:hypothetical protein